MNHSKRIFLFFEILRFDLLMAIFRSFLAVFGLFCVCSRPVGHSFWPRVLIFGMKDPWEHHSKRIFCFSKF